MNTGSTTQKTGSGAAERPGGRRLRVTGSPEETRALGREIGRRAAAGTVLALSGDLGSGKTVLVQGLARGLGVPPDIYVTSPTYTLINDYPGRLRLYHIDLYRLDGAEAVEELGLDEILAGDGVTALEWAERLEAGALRDHLWLEIRTGTANRREIRIEACGPRARDILNALAPGPQIPVPAEEHR